MPNINPWIRIETFSFWIFRRIVTLSFLFVWILQQSGFALILGNMLTKLDLLCHVRAKGPLKNPLNLIDWANQRLRLSNFFLWWRQLGQNFGQSVICSFGVWELRLAHRAPTFGLIKIYPETMSKLKIVLLFTLHTTLLQNLH